MPTVEIDFESRSKIDIIKCGAGRYAADPSTRILCTCWAVDNGPVMGLMGEEIPEIFIEAVEQGWEFSAFNAMFEQLIWKYRWPNLPLPKFRCTRALVASHGLPQSLDRACKSLKLPFTKDLDGRRLINTYSKPNKEGGFNDLTEEDKGKLLSYCAKDVLLSRAIRKKIPALSEFEQEVYDWTSETNMRGMLIDTKLAKKASLIAEQLLKKGNEKMKVITNDRIHSVTQVQRIKKHLKEEYGLEVESLDKKSIAMLLSQPLTPEVKQILELRRDLSQTSVRKYERAEAATCPDGRVRDMLVYHGASTGRWTSQVVQFQNLVRYRPTDPVTALNLVMLGDAELFDLCYDNPMKTLSSCLRGLVLPPKDKKLAVVDYNAIEARVLMWAAGQKDAVSMFHKGVDLYVEMARVIYNNKSLTKEDKKERFLGKTTTLGAGYGMGRVKFQGTCEGYGIELGEKTEVYEKEDKEGNVTKFYYSPLAQTAIESYRSRFPEVPRFWYGMQSAAERCMRTGKRSGYRDFSFTREDDFMYLNLPSYRRLAYHHPGIDKDGLYYYTEDSTTHQYGKKRLWGGLIVENAIQALARDILAYGILRLESAGWPVILTVHDENIIEMQTGEHWELENIINMMCTLPEWAETCPIKAEGFITERYRKG